LRPNKIRRIPKDPVNNPKYPNFPSGIFIEGVVVGVAVTIGLVGVNVGNPVVGVVVAVGRTGVLVGVTVTATQLGSAVSATHYIISSPWWSPL